MHIKIVDYTKYDINKIKAFNFIVDSIYDIYKKKKDSLNSDFLDLTPELLIDSQCGHVFVVFEFSKGLGEQDLDSRFSLFFGLFHNFKCSSFILNYKFNKLLIPKLTDYFNFLKNENSSDKYILFHFNEFEDINVTMSKLSGCNYSILERLTTLSDFIYNRFSIYCNYDNADFISLNKIKWLYPYCDHESNGRYKNISIFSEELPLNYFEIKSLENRVINERNYTIVIDTETNGLPDNYNDTWPYLSYPNPVQISWSIFDKYDNLVEFRDYIIKQERPISKDSILIHGIDDEIAREEGVQITTVLEELIDSIEYCDEIVGHNLEFDLKVLQKSYFVSSEMGYHDSIGFINKFNLKHYCTMKESMKYFNFYKYPKLSDLYKFIFKCEPEGLHNSTKDIEYTYAIYTWLKVRRINDNSI